MEENILPVYIEDEVRQSYLDYAMSVIVGRALPDVKDGLKPVQRRILYSMKELGLLPQRPYKKSAAVIGDVLGKYHPHGDGAIYDALARMVQEFSLRYPLIDGQGNFGSVDGDPPAAYRYTEARLTPLAIELLKDIEKDTVDFQPNFDGSRREPTVLPSSFPNLIVNGSSGIAVGMATNIPPHNFGEVIDATVAFIENPDISIEDLMHHIKGPDFPTGGVIMGEEGIKEAYEKGRGRIILRGKLSVEERKGGKEAIVITEIPYQVNKAQLIEKIAYLVREKRITDISDIKDESDRESIRIVLELKRGAQKEVIINSLYGMTPLQVTYSIILLAIVELVPRIMSLKEMISQFVEFRHEVVKRRTQFELKKAEERAHILEGLKKCLDKIDEVIAVIKSSKDPDTARGRLMKKFALSEKQAQAILEMRLQRLTGLEREKIEKEYLELIKEIERLKTILSSRALILEVIKQELLELKKKYADERRTEIVKEKPEEIKIEDLIKEEDVVVLLTKKGYIKRIPLTVYRKQQRGGGGKTVVDVGDEDFVISVIIASTHDHLLFFSNLGKVYTLRVFDIPEASQYSKGKPLVQFFELGKEEKISSVTKVSLFSLHNFIFMITEKGLVKKVSVASFSNIRRSGTIAINFQDKDRLVDAFFLDKEKDVMIFTSLGNCIRFSSSLVRPMGRYAAGVRGIRMSPEDRVIAGYHANEKEDIVVVTEKGYGKRIRIKELPGFKTRGGKGVRFIRVNEKSGRVAYARGASEEDEIIIITKKGMSIRIPVSSVKLQKRNSLGVKLISLKQDDEVADFGVMKKSG